MHHSSLVSIIIPVYNTGKHLVASLDSVLAQTYSNIEILIVDDKSTDPLTLEILLSYAQKDARIKLFLQNENTGCGGCRNFAVDLCSGQYLTFFDSDDRMSTDFIEKMVDSIKKHQTDFVLCHALNIALPETTVQFDPHELYFPKQNKEVFTTQEFIKTHQLLSIPITPFARLFNTQKYKDANISFIPKMFAQDHDWTLRIFCELSSFAIVDFPGIFRVVRNDSACHKISEHLCQSVLKALRLRYELLNKYGYFQIYRIDFFLEAANYFVRLGKQIPNESWQHDFLYSGFKLLQECGYPISIKDKLEYLTQNSVQLDIQVDKMQQAMNEFFTCNQDFLKQVKMID